MNFNRHYKNFTPMMSNIAFWLIFNLLLSTHTVYISDNDRAVHEVQAGETLFSISQQYEISVDELQKWNNLDDTSIEIGQELYVEPLDEEVTTDIDEQEEYNHSVQSGETLFSISRTYGVEVNQILEWNEMESTDLTVGQELTIYTGRDVDQPDEHDDPDEAVAEEGEFSTYNYHTVRRSETLYRIAGQYNMSADELIELNDDIDGPEDIEAGLELRVRSFISMPSVFAEARDAAPQGAFYTYRYSESESIDEILGHNRMDESEFRALNPGLEPENIEPGELLTLIAPGTASQKNPYRISDSANGTGDGIQFRMYDEEEEGTTTTSGELYNPDHLTAAHSDLPLGSIVYVENPVNGRGVFVLVNDRITGDGLKVSQAVREALNLSESITREILLTKIPD